jgi:hypothetical protein
MIKRAQRLGGDSLLERGRGRLGVTHFSTASRAFHRKNPLSALKVSAAPGIGVNLTVRALQQQRRRFLHPNPNSSLFL